MPRTNQQQMEGSLRQTERVYLRLASAIFAGLCLLVAVSWGGHRAYVRWQERKLMQQAHAAFDKMDLRWAILAAQRAYNLDDASVDACRTLADIAEQQSNVEAIEWRRRALAIEPASLSNRLAMVKTALRFTQPAIAASVLAQVPQAQQMSADYQAAAARVALTENDLPKAGEHLRAAVRLAPNDPGHAVELAEYQLRSDDRAARDAGRATAMRLKENPKVRLDALHILLNAALRERDVSGSIALARELDAVPDAPLADRLLALGILRQSNDPAFTAVLTRFEADSAGSADRAVRLLNWMNTHGLALLAIDWSKRLPPEMLGGIPLRLALADSYVQLRDWSALAAMLKRGSWDRVESFRLALQAKVARETGDDPGFEKAWAQAIVKAGNDNGRLDVLQKLAFQWHWTDKAVAVLWSLAENPPIRKDALQSLYRYYAAERDTAGLYRALARLVAIMPDDPLVRNNFAQISLLLHAEPARARALALEVHQQQPKNAAFASTYAFGLFQNGDVQGALKVMSSLTPAQLQDPSVAAYYGVVLAAVGRNPEAVKFLDAAAGAQLLPEEEKLIAEARQTMARQRHDGGT